ncbi:GerMN domain-containing protein [Lachnospiraceae bacterium 62-35]
MDIERNIKKMRLLLAGMGIFCLFFAGCGRTQETDSTRERKQGEYNIYYLNGSATKLVPQRYETTTKDIDQLVEELMIQFLSVPQDLDCQPALSDKAAYQEFNREDRVVYLYFDAAYTGMKPEREILCRAALAKTLTQIDGVDFINIYAGGQPLLDQKGAMAGMIADTDFIDNISDVNAYAKVELVLYFTDEKGEKLYREKREVVHNVNTSMEQLVVEELISGPQAFHLCPTVPRDTKILNVSVNDNVCYLNFASSFLGGSLEVKDYIPIYSVVNSLAELSSVSRVQFSINGSTDVKFRDTLSLDSTFERNLDCIEEEGN